MNFTFNIGELAGLLAAAVFVGGALESLRRLTASSVSQGKRLGLLEDWKAATVAVATYREQRVNTAALGIPVRDE